MKKHNKGLSRVDEMSTTESKVIVQNKLNFVPKVSVIIPVYNVSEYLPQCLDSVLNQTLKEIEVICVNDGSTDNSLEILEEYAKKDSRITVITQKRTNAGAARNVGLDVACGEWIGFIDSDDYINKNMYEKLYNLASEKVADVCICAFAILDDKIKKVIGINNGVNTSYISEFKKDKAGILLNSAGKPIFQITNPAPWNKIYNKQFLKDNKIRFQSIISTNDVAFTCVALACSIRIGVCYDNLYTYRTKTNKSLTDKKDENLMCFYDAIKELRSRLIQRGIFEDFYRSFFNASIDYMLYNFAKVNNKSKNILKRLFINEAFKEFDIKPETLNLVYKEANRQKCDMFLQLRDMPAVSIVLPIYNAGPYLRECLDSVVNQTLKNIEIICVNDGSKDNSLDIIKEYANKDIRIRYIDKPNAGYGQTMNCGMDIATGEYIGIVEPDDYIELNMYEVLYKHAKKENVDFVKSDIYFWYSLENSRVYSNIIADKNLYGKVQTDLSQIGLVVGAIANSSGIYKRDFLYKNDIRYQETPGASFQDQGFYYQVMMYAKSGLFLNIPFYHYRQDNSNSSINSPDKAACIINEYRFIKKKLDSLPNKDNFLQMFYTKMINSYLWNLSKASIELHPVFRKKISEEFNRAVEIGELSEELVGKTTWKKVRSFLGNHVMIPVILASDDNYAQFMYVTMVSMLENAKPETFYDFFLMVPGAFSDKNAGYILSLKDKYDCEIHFIDMKDEFSDLKMQISHITSPTYYRLLAGDLLPKEYDKCIYLDVDVCVCKDLSELYDTDVDGYYIAGVPAAGYYFNEAVNCKRLNLPDMRQYVNAGVLLMNLKKIREDNLTSKFLELSKKDFSSQDQDVINVACYGKIKILPLKFNAIPKRLKENNIKLRDLFTENEIMEAKNSPVIVHYADRVKPWKSAAIYMGNIWWQYAGIAGMATQDFIRPILQQWFKDVTGHELDLDNPKTFNEKIQWLKLYNSTPLKTRLADKYLVRDWVAEKIGEKYLIPLLGVYDRFEDIDFSKLPDRFVIKCNHGCAYNIIVKDKSKLDLDDVKAKLNKWLNENFAYKAGFELHYRDIPPKIIIEQYMENSGSDALYDYKFWCFNGKVKYMQFRDDFSKDLKMVFYDLKWKKQPFYYDHPLYEEDLQKPDNFDEMVEIAKKLCRGFEFVCVDLYRLNDGKIYFGEMTFTRSSGSAHWNKYKYNLMFGNMLKLPKLAYNIDTGKYYKLPKKSKTATYLLFPYYLFKLARQKRKYNRLIAKKLTKKLNAFKIDAKNVGKAGNNLNIIADNLRLIKYDNGQAVIVDGADLNQEIRIVTVGSGILDLSFQSQDGYFKGARFPLYVDFSSIKVDGRELLLKPFSACYDKPFTYSMPVKDGQSVNIVIKQKPHKYSKSELCQIITKLSPDSDYVKKNAKAIVKQLRNHIGGKHNADKNAEIMDALQALRVDILTVIKNQNNLERTIHEITERLNADTDEEEHPAEK